MNQQRFWLFKRGSVYYVEDKQTKKQQSLWVANYYSGGLGHLKESVAV